MLSLEEKEKKDTCEACVRKGEKGHMWGMCKVNLVPRIFYLSPSREEEREP